MQQNRFVIRIGGTHTTKEPINRSPGQLGSVMPPRGVVGARLTYIIIFKNEVSPRHTDLD